MAHEFGLHVSLVVVRFEMAATQFDILSQVCLAEHHVAGRFPPLPPPVVGRNPVPVGRQLLQLTLSNDAGKDFAAKHRLIRPLLIRLLCLTLLIFQRFLFVFLLAASVLVFLPF